VVTALVELLLLVFLALGVGFALGLLGEPMLFAMASFLFRAIGEECTALIGAVFAPIVLVVTEAP
jgi:hypothetical protein